MPSVRGQRKTLVGGLFVSAGTLSGALLGFVAALPFLILSSPGPRIVAVIASIGVGLDLIRLATGRPSPPTSGRQVPQEWGRLLGPEAVAVLYGARLGIGPLTILSTWTWWSVLIAASLVGPGTGAAVGAGFGFVRLMVTVAASALASRSVDPLAHTAWFGRLRRRQRSNWAVLNGAGLLLVGAVLLTGCGASERPVAAPKVPPVTATTAAATWNPPPSTEPGPETDTEIQTAIESETAPPTVPVRLEDVVRTATTPPPATTDEATTTEPATVEAAAVDHAVLFSTEPEALAAALPVSLEGFSPIDGVEANRFLDLTAASEIQPDPTEEVSLLETRGFAGGWTRAFRNETNDVAVVSVYHFEDATEAEFYLEDGLITIGGYGGKFFDIPALPGVRGFVQYFTEPATEAGDQPEELVSLGAAFQLGPRWHLVYLVGSVDTVTPDVLIPAVTSLSESAGQA